MHSPRRPLFLPVWAANLFDRVAEHHDDDRWYSRMMNALLECDDWTGYYHRQAAAVLNDIVLPNAGTASNLVRQTIALHRTPPADRSDWIRHYHTLFHSACVDECPRYSPVERNTIKASLHSCLETPLKSRPYDPVWSVVFGLSAAGDRKDAEWQRVAQLLLETARQVEFDAQLSHS